ncbi:MutH/Sau3AI family endonuclease [Segatella maculosa]|uniref:MutH/Sau3AI family endonuclease n=1 Tax=Segatella maculosa TaxID=439703 RepID=UPI0028D9094D|nr:MutH/Sau3AI family endonuclease [Segatella maculosa]
METYDLKSPEAIEAYAKQLQDKSLRQYFGNDVTQTYHGKGNLGQLLESAFFNYAPNSKAEPDFMEAGVELKSTPLKTTKKGALVSKERLVLNIINYFEEVKVNFRNSSFWHKNQHLLLMFYLWEADCPTLDYVFKIISLWRFPAKDLKIIKDDWLTIQRKIKNGKADEITEGDTLYMAACMKGRDKVSSQCDQPYSEKKAQRRAYSLKNKYMNSVINTLLATGKPDIDDEEIEWVLESWEDGMAHEPFDAFKTRKKQDHTEAIIKNIKQYKDSQETFEQYVERQFIPYLGMTDRQIIEKKHIEKYNAKSKYAIITKAILGISKDNIEEFEKANITMKAIRLSKTDRLEQHISFPTIQYKEIVNEEWEDSQWYETLNSKFFFAIYREHDKDKYTLVDAFFWNMPGSDQTEAERLWRDTRDKIRRGDFTHFGKASESNICHVRPHGRDSHDLMQAPNGSFQKKYCFWLNSKYIKAVIDKREETRNHFEKSESNI